MSYDSGSLSYYWFKLKNICTDSAGQNGPSQAFSAYVYREQKPVRASLYLDNMVPIWISGMS